MLKKGTKEPPPSRRPSAEELAKLKLEQEEFLKKRPPKPITIPSTIPEDVLVMPQPDQPEIKTHKTPPKAFPKKAPKVTVTPTVAPEVRDEIKTEVPKGPLKFDWATENVRDIGKLLPQVPTKYLSDVYQMVNIPTMAKILRDNQIDLEELRKVNPEAANELNNTVVEFRSQVELLTQDIQNLEEKRKMEIHLIDFMNAQKGPVTEELNVLLAGLQNIGKITDETAGEILRLEKANIAIALNIPKMFKGSPVTIESVSIGLLQKTLDRARNGNKQAVAIIQRELAELEKRWEEISQNSSIFLNSAKLYIPVDAEVDQYGRPVGTLTSKQNLVDMTRKREGSLKQRGALNPLQWLKSMIDRSVNFLSSYLTKLKPAVDEVEAVAKEMEAL